MATELQRPTPPQSSELPVGESSHPATAESENMCHEGATKEIPDTPDRPELKPSRTTVILVLLSVLMSVFVVALDRTIIATVRRIPTE